MSMLSSIFGAVLGQVGQQGGNAGMIANVVGGLLANDGGQGGLGGLVGKFQQAGMGDVIGSWVGGGQNMPISAEHFTLIQNNRHSIVTNFRGRLINDILTTLITTSYEKK